MLKQHRGFFVSTALIGLALSLGAAGWYLNPYRLPDPESASQTRLLTWLAVNDVARHPRDFQVQLVDRFQRELEAGTLSYGSGSKISAPDKLREQVVTNARYLKRVWFEARAEQYAGCEPSRQMPFLLRQIEAVEQWSALRSQSRKATPAAHTKSASPPGKMLAFFREAEHWIEQADEMRKPLFRKALHDTLLCWVSHRSLETRPLAVRIELARSTENALRDYFSASHPRSAVEPSQSEIASSLHGLNAQQRQQLAANALLLAEAWLHHLAERYESVPEQQRLTFIDERVAELKSWTATRGLSHSRVLGSPASTPLASESPAPPSATAGLVEAAGLGSLPEILQTVDEFIARAPTERRDRFERFVQDAKSRVAWHAFRAAMPSRAERR